MKITFYSTKPYEVGAFKTANSSKNLALNFLEENLNTKTIELAKDSDAICIFVNDTVSPEIIDRLGFLNIKIILLRSAGFNNVDIEYAQEKQITVARVPVYSPFAVAEHAVALLLTLIRKTHKAYMRIREGNFTLDGLVGFDLHGKTVGLIGAGNIGTIFKNIMVGFGCKVIIYDPVMKETGPHYASLDRVLTTSDIISLHCPLNKYTQGLINASNIKKMKPGVIIINTARGAIIDDNAIIEGLQQGHIGGLAVDVYTKEAGLFFNDLSSQIINDSVFTTLAAMPNVLITGHQAFLTKEALNAIAEITLDNAEKIYARQECKNVLT